MRQNLRYLFGAVVVVFIAVGAFYMGRTMPARYVVDAQCRINRAQPNLQQVVLYWSDGTISFAPYFKYEQRNPTADFAWEIYPGDGKIDLQAIFVCDSIGVDRGFLP